MFTVRQTCYFSAAHILIGYPAGCERLHGHNYRVIVEVCAYELDKLGMVMDYVDIEKVAYMYINKLDHRFLNEIEPFDKINPTTENIAHWLYKNIAPDIKTSQNNRVFLKSITIWETDHNSVIYQEND